MKKIIFIFTVIMILTSCNKIAHAQYFEAEGNISHIQEGSLYVVNRFSPQQDTLAKTTLKNGKFYLKGDYPTTALFDVNVVMFQVLGIDESSFSGVFFIEKDKKVILNNPRDTELYFSGTHNIDLINEFFQNTKSKGEIITEVSIGGEQYADSINTLKSQIGKEVYEFIRANEDSQILEAGLAMLFGLIDANMFNGDNLAYFQSVINKIAEKSFIAQIGLQLIQSKHLIKEGQMAPNFTINNFTLSSQKGKPIILVFWASWCAPCIANIDKLKEVYHKFRLKDLEIIGISSDTHKEQHQKALDKYKLPWLNLIDDTNPLTSIYRLYLANSIPYYILINQEGIIEKISSEIDLIEDNVQKIIK